MSQNLMCGTWLWLKLFTISPVFYFHLPCFSIVWRQLVSCNWVVVPNSEGVYVKFPCRKKSVFLISSPVREVQTHRADGMAVQPQGVSQSKRSVRSKQWGVMGVAGGRATYLKQTQISHLFVLFLPHGEKIKLRTQQLKCQGEEMCFWEVE